MLQDLWLSGLLWRWWRTVEIHKRLGIWLAERLSATPERRCCMKSGHQSLQTKDTLYIDQQGQQCTYNVTFRRVRVTIFVVEKAVSIPYPECVFVALVIQHAKRMRLIILYCHLWPVRLYNVFPHYLINGTIFGEKSYWTQNVCFDFLRNFCLKHFSF
jgi:hypothetical protein